MKKITSKRILTKEGTAIWSSLTKVDNVSKKYQISIKLTEEEAAPIIALTDKIADELGISNKTYKVEKDTGLIIITAKMKSEYMKNNEVVKMQPKMFNVDKEPMEVIEIENRSKIKLAIQLSPYTNYGKGISIRLEAIQLIEMYEEEVDIDLNDFEDLESFEELESVDEIENPFNGWN